MMKIEINGHQITLNDIDPIPILIFLGDKVDRKILNDIAPVDFSIVVRPSDCSKFITREGDYTILIREDDGEEFFLGMPHRGAKMLYLLTLLCQKAVGGLPNKFFKNRRAATAIAALYDKLYRSGGEQWVDKCATKDHNLSTFRTHAKDAVEDSKSLDNVQRYWCGFEDEKRTIGANQLLLKRIRIPNDRIVFEDSAKSRVTFKQIMEQLPPLEDLFGFWNNTTERILNLQMQKATDNLSHG